ncbi:MAG: HPr family phosphocarrier protein, partial [Planctomycetales bacterium]|nr:HPr family phosphocarrier protein [Planctomycetales bacterium]
MNCPVITRTAIVRNPNGLHLRPAGVLSKMAGEFTAQVQICKDGLCVD